MNKRQLFRDINGNTASISSVSAEYRLICRDYYGKEWKRGIYATASEAKEALCETGETWHTTSGYVD